MGHRFGTTQVLAVAPVALHPGESRALVALRGHGIGSVFQILAMGVTQHPDSLYVYSADGVPIRSPVPLGEFHAPLYTCRDLGAFLDVQQDFRISVRNDGDAAHRYAAMVWYRRERV